MIELLEEVLVDMGKSSVDIPWSLEPRAECEEAMKVRLAGGAFVLGVAIPERRMTSFSLTPEGRCMVLKEREIERLRSELRTTYHLLRELCDRKLEEV